MRRDLDKAVISRGSLRRFHAADLHILRACQTQEERLARLEDLGLRSRDGEVDLLAHRNVHLCPARAKGGDGLDDLLHSGFFRAECEFLAVDRPLGGNQELACVGNRLPDLLGDERHERVQEAQRLIKDIDQNLLRGKLTLFVLAVKTRLRELNIPVAVGVPDEIINLAGRNADLVRVEICRDLANERVEFRQDPHVLLLQVLPGGKAGLANGEVHEDIAACIPDLVCKVPHRLALFHIEAHVVAGRVAGDEVEAQRVCAVFFGHLEGVDAVAKRLGHFSSLVIAHEAMDKDGLERLFFHLLHA